jgi:hypothetical protein
MVRSRIRVRRFISIPSQREHYAVSEILYKFMPSVHGLTAIAEKRLKVTGLSELNDIFDCAPVPGPIDDESGYLSPDWTEKVVKQNVHTHGVLCFSKNPRSPLLWGHYAASATGLVLGFDSALLTWKNRMDIKYDKSRPILKWPADVDTTEAEMSNLLSTCFGVKASEWEYEQEVRYVVELQKCKPLAGMYFDEFPYRALSLVIIGTRSLYKVNYVYNFIQHHCPDHHVKLFAAKVHPTRYEVIFERFGSDPLEELF